jgi:hypothetical protein
VVAKELLCHLQFAVAIKGRGSVFAVDQAKLFTKMRVGDAVEFCGVDPPIRATIKSISQFHGPPPPKVVLGVMVSPDVSPDAMKRNPEVWKISD